MVLVAALMMALVAAVPALAQGEAEQGKTGDPPPKAEPPAGESITAAFELTVEGEPPEGAEFFGRLVPPPGAGGGASVSLVPLADPDGDGIYTGSDTLPVGPSPDGSLPDFLTNPPTAQIVQVTGPYAPYAVRVIRDFGLVLPDEDNTFEASVSFPDDGSVGEDVTATFELAVRGEVPEGTGFSGSIGSAPIATGALLDQDGDGVYTTSLPVELGSEQEVRIERLDPINNDPEAPLAASTLREFGLVKFDEDKTFRARINLNRDRGGTTPPGGTTPEPGSGGSDDGGPSGGGSGNSGSDAGGDSGNGSSPGSSGSGSDGSISGGSADGGGSSHSGSNGGSFGDGIDSGSGSETGGIRNFLPIGLLPSTGGGMSLVVLGAGALLIGGGLLLRKIFR